MRTDARELLAVGMCGRGSALGSRIEALLHHGRDFSPRASAGAVIASAAGLGCMMLAASLAPRWVAFAQEPSRVSFEVASLKPTPVARRGLNFGSYYRSQPGGRFTAENVSLGMLVMKAYQVDSKQIAGGDSLRFGGETYDIEAKADGLAQTNGPAGHEALLDSMIQTLLADRFHLAVHRETKETSGYALVIAKGGSKLKEPTGTRDGDGSISVEGRDG